MTKMPIYLIIVLLSIDSAAQSQTADSIKKRISLHEVVITAPNITRIDNHLLILPTEQQRKHANNGYGVLKNLMIPGLTIDTELNNVEAMGMQASLYINGQECDSKEIRMIRPRDIEKIEYHDAPTGKYAKDKIAINFVLKQYKYGGYFQLDGLQMIGYTRGDYNLAGSISQGNTTCSLFAGANYQSVNDNKSTGSESYFLPQETVFRTINSCEKYRKHNEYAQLRIQNQKGKRYFVGKLSFVNNSTPKIQSAGIYTMNETSSLFDTRTAQNNIAPKLDFNGNIPLSDTENLSFGLHGRYSHNTYDRNYREAPFKSEVHESENVGDFQLSAIYDHYGKNNSFSAELYHYHNIWDANYTGDNPVWQHLWQGESLGFIAYNHRFTKKLSLQSRVGLDWLQYRLHGNNKFSQFSPRANLNVRYQMSPWMLLWSFSYVNSNHGMDVINNARVDINSYMTETGNPNLRKSHELNSYLYYSTKLKKVGLTAMCQYKLEHNPVIHDYHANNSQIVKTYINESDYPLFLDHSRCDLFNE